MKKIWIALGLFVSVAAGAQNKFTIKGNIAGSAMPVQKLMMYYRADGKNLVDSTELKNNTYAFSGRAEEPTQVTLVARYAPGADGKPTRTSRARDLVSLFVEPGNEVSVSSVDSFANATVKGSRANEAYAALNLMLKQVSDQMSAASAIYSKAAAAQDEPARKAAENVLDSLDNIRRGVHRTYLLNNPQSPIALYALTQFAGYDINANEVDPLFKNLPAMQQSSPSGKIFSGKLETARKTSVGSIAMDFSQNDTLGKPVKLSAFRGKYVLVDFWASWCGPCRRENPNVVKTYQAFRDKNFTILGVSLDRPDAKDKWIDAIHQDNLAWTHVSDLQFWQNEVARLYGIEAIPQNLLIDPSGKIIAKNLNGEKLEKKLMEIFSN